MISCSPSTRKVAEPAAYAFARAIVRCTSAVPGYAKHDYQRREQHLVAAACNLQEYAQRYKYQGGEQLVRRTEQRPDVCIADTGQNEAAQQG